MGIGKQVSNDIERDKSSNWKKSIFDRPQLKVNRLEIERINEKSDQIVSDRLTSINANSHCVLTGQTGSGKTYGLLYPLIIL